MKFKNEINICINIKYTVIENNEIKNYNLFYIKTETMRLNNMKKSIKQAFIDVSFKCVPHV